MEKEFDEEEVLEAITLQDDDGNDFTVYIIDNTTINGVNYLLATDTQDDGGEAYIFIMKEDEEDPEYVSLEPIPEKDYDYVLKVFSEQSDIELVD